MKSKGVVGFLVRTPSSSSSMKVSRHLKIEVKIWNFVFHTTRALVVFLFRRTHLHEDDENVSKDGLIFFRLSTAEQSSRNLLCWPYPRAHSVTYEAFISNGSGFSSPGPVAKSAFSRVNSIPLLCSAPGDSPKSTSIFLFPLRCRPIRSGNREGKHKRKHTN